MSLGATWLTFAGFSVITEQPLKLSRMVQDGSHIHEKVAECIQTQTPKNALAQKPWGQLRQGNTWSLEKEHMTSASVLQG